MEFSLQDCKITLCGIELTEWQSGEVVIIAGRRRPKIEELRRRRREFKARVRDARARRRNYNLARKWFSPKIAEWFSARIAEYWSFHLEELNK